MCSLDDVKLCAEILAFCNVLHNYMGVSGPSLLIESTDSMICQKLYILAGTKFRVKCRKSITNIIIRFYKGWHYEPQDIIPSAHGNHMVLINNFY